MARPPGRPRGFDREEVLTQVYKTFRSRGFAATSLDDIAAATGLNRPSLYAAFGDKRAMYLAAIGVVRDGIAASADRLDAAGLDLRGTLEQLFEGSIRAYLSGDTGPQGCLAIGTATSDAVADPEIRAALAEVLHLIDRRVAHWFAQAGSTDPQGRARLVAAVMHSMSIRARAGQPVEDLQSMAADALDLLAPASG